MLYKTCIVYAHFAATVLATFTLYSWNPQNGRSGQIFSNISVVEAIGIMYPMSGSEVDYNSSMVWVMCWPRPFDELLLERKLTKVTYVLLRPWAPFHYAVRRLTAKYRAVWKPRVWMLKISYRSKSWQASRQCCCRCAYQISNRLEKYKPDSRDLSVHEILR